MLSVQIEEKDLPFLVDTGATCSTLKVVPSGSLSSHTITLMGFSGEKKTLPFTKPLLTQVGKQTVTHPFVHSPSVPMNLLGRDLLIKLGATILCSADGLVVVMPDGSHLPCSGRMENITGQYLVQPVNEQYADIYWGLLQPETSERRGILSAYLQWKPWISQLEPYVSPPDFPHVTLFYDGLQTDWYQENFQDQLEGRDWHINTHNIYVAPEGVAAGVDLTSEQLPWYMMAEEAAPHVSLALHPQHQAKELGSIVKRALLQSDWVHTQLPQVQYSAQARTYRIQVSGEDTVTLEHAQISRHHGRERTDHVESAALLAKLPEHLWAQGPTDVGQVKCKPITFQVREGSPIWIRQYPHKPQAEEGLRDTIDGLFQKGVLEPSSSDWNTPILPIEKKGTGKYRMAHDLRAINDILLTPTVPVPNPYVALTNLDPNHEWFTCIDLANAFFCLPLAEECRPIFSFSYHHQQLQYTRLPQGFALSPGIFNQVLKDILTDCPLPEQVTLVQYVDDLLLAAPTAALCLEATNSVLLHLARTGFKVSKAKLQVVRRQVAFLGRQISQKGAGLSPQHRSTILHHSRPVKVKDMLSFLGLTGYSRTYIANYTGLTRPLRDLVKEQGVRNLSAALNWTQEAEAAFIALKQALSSAADLAIPDYSLPFYLDVSGTELCTNGVLFQRKGGERVVLMYVSVMLDNMEKRHPMCTQQAAGIAKLIQKTAHIVMGHQLHILTTHSVVAYVNSQTFTLTALRQRRLSKILEAPNLTFTHDGINMADQLGTGEPHECTDRVQKEEKVRLDLQTEPIPRARELYTDGCCFRDEREGLKAAYAVVEEVQGEIITRQAERMEGQQSAQRAEVLAVIAALRLGEGQEVNIYTDSAYAAGAVHVELKQWLRAGFLTATNKPIRHETEMKELAEALLLPSKVAVIKCKGHEKSDSPTKKGNDAADMAAKTAAGYVVKAILMCAETEKDTDTTALIAEQNAASPQEKTLWKARGATEVHGLWRGPDGRPILPPGIRQTALAEAHGVGHVGVAQMMRNLEHWWHPYIKDMAKHFVSSCEECLKYNVRPTVKPHPGRYPLEVKPGKEIIIDYTDMITPVKGYRYILMCVDAYSGWPEAWPTKKEDGKSVIKFLINHYIPRHGFPERIRSDNGTHFKNQDLQQVEAMLGLKHKFGTVYHPQSQGKVERLNQTVKNKLAKICAQTKMNWLDALPLALMSIRSSVNQATRFTPHELQTGRAFPGPQSKLPGTGHIDQDLNYKMYFHELQSLVAEFSKQVASSRGEGQTAPAPAAEWVLLRVIKRKWSEPRWTGPYQVTERTSHAVRVKGKGDTWYHWSQCAAAEEPRRSLAATHQALKDLHIVPAGTEEKTTNQQGAE